MTVAEARAREIVTHQLTIEHESAHSAAALALGFDLKEIDVARPSPRERGRTSVAGVLLRPRDFALLVLAGPLCDEGRADPTWPLGGSDENDEHILRQITNHLDYQESDWDELVSDALKLVTRDDFSLAQRVFASLLHDHPVIRGELLDVVIHCIRHQNSEERDRAA